ncbi:hypothetical protein HQN90_19295 [Paenibacillus alba]|uniref:hypothetical protein n=1 Tax=Paenibacillus alba TaxID=1197127 RepID=UPI0015633E99|nr:hypothetical protein [Paenibacillus alba]NQX68275.1 hypothetical protein [Paenibacillus alba]
MGQPPFWHAQLAFPARLPALRVEPAFSAGSAGICSFFTSETAFGLAQLDFDRF